MAEGQGILEVSTPESPDDVKKTKKTKKTSSSSSKTTKKSVKDKKQPSSSIAASSDIVTDDGIKDADASSADRKKPKKTPLNKADKTKKKVSISAAAPHQDDNDGNNSTTATSVLNEASIVGKTEQQASPPKMKARLIAPKNTKRADGTLQYDKLWSSTAKQAADRNAAATEEEEEGVATCVLLLPIPPPNNPPSERKITLILKQPDLSQLKMLRVDPANTNIRMVREFLHTEYYKNHDIPRHEQRQLLYRMKPIFDDTMDPNVDDAKTLADHGIDQDNAVIELSKMHVYVISPSTQKSMMINNIDPMNDVIFDMKKLAVEDGYPVERLRLLHKEAGDREIKKDKNNSTFFDCGVKHEHTLILEWPQIVLKVRLPVVSDGVGEREFELVDLKVQAELDTVDKIHEFILERTGISREAQSLLWTAFGKTTGKKKSQQPVDPKKLANPKKILAEYKVQENDVIELEPMTVRVNLVGAGGAANPSSTTMVLDDVYPLDTIGYIKGRIELGGSRGRGGDGDEDFPSILRTNQSLFKHDGGKELRRDQQTLQDAGVMNGNELDVEKTKITIHVRLPESKCGTSKGKGGKVVEIGVNPKLDDTETIKDLLADKTGLPKEFFPPLSFQGNKMEADGLDTKKKLVDFCFVDGDVIDVEAMTLYVNVTSGDKKEIVCLDGIDPFNDTVEDIKRRLGPEDLNLLPVDKQRLRFMRTDLDEIDDDGIKRTPSSPSRKLFDCKIKNMDTIDLEKSKIDVTIQTPNGTCLELKGVDPRKDNLETIRSFVSEEYYRGKDKDGSIPENQLRPLTLGGKPMKDAKKSLREYGITDDGKTVQLEPMTVRLSVGTTEDDVSGGEIITLNDIDPMNDNIHDVKQRATGDGTPSAMLTLLHQEAQMKEIEEEPGKPGTFYDYGVNHCDTLVIRRKPVTIRVKLPVGSKILCRATDRDDRGDNVKVLYDDEDDTTILAVRVDPDKADFDTIRKHVLHHVGVPIVAQRLNRLEADGDEGIDAAPKKERIDVPGGTRLSAPELNLGDGCTIELEPMTINVKTERGKIISLPILPSDTVEDVKKKLANDAKVRIPFDRQRLLTEDCTELGGDEDNEGSIGSDKSTLLELGVGDGDTLCVEKSKISLTVKMPHGMDDVIVLVDPKNGNVDQIRQSIFDATGLPKEHQQRLKRSDGLMDDGYRDNSESGDSPRKATSLSKFLLKENDCITLEPPILFVLQVPEKKQFVIADVDLRKCTVQDLKKLVAAETRMPTFKQRLLNPKTDEEFVGNKDSAETLHDHGIQDGDWINLEKNRIDFRIVLPALNELEMTVDPRKDDLQKIRDHVFKKYYNKRVVPKEDLRPMLVRSHIVLDDEPGGRKLIEFGIKKDGDHVKLSPSTLTIDTPRRVVFCPNADIFHDTLDIITKFVELEAGISTKGLHIQFNEKKLTDYKSVLYDLGISDGSTLNFLP